MMPPIDFLFVQFVFDAYFLFAAKPPVNTRDARKSSAEIVDNSAAVTVALPLIAC
jgi:hypothetical protein